MLMPVNNSFNSKNPSFSASVYKEVGTKVLDSAYVKRGIYSFSLLAKKLDHRISFQVNGDDTILFRNLANGEEGPLACKLSEAHDSVSVIKTLVESVARKFPDIKDFAPKFLEESSAQVSKGWHRPHIKDEMQNNIKHEVQV